MGIVGDEEGNVRAPQTPPQLGHMHDNGIMAYACMRCSSCAARRGMWCAWGTAHCDLPCPALQPATAATPIAVAGHCLGRHSHSHMQRPRAPPMTKLCRGRKGRALAGWAVGVHGISALVTRLCVLTCTCTSPDDAATWHAQRMPLPTPCKAYAYTRAAHQGEEASERASQEEYGHRPAVGCRAACMCTCMRSTCTWLLLP
mmetsp:Transcript_87313/g.174392  ORF Transcript_87313/g.174392 Transcript_87313/m.174392 type:complete len:201 (+) Transcript_87313:228-830(+)